MQVRVIWLWDKGRAHRGVQLSGNVIWCVGRGIERDTWKMEMWEMGQREECWEGNLGSGNVVMEHR